MRHPPAPPAAAAARPQCPLLHSRFAARSQASGHSMGKPKNPFAGRHVGGTTKATRQPNTGKKKRQVAAAAGDGGSGGGGKKRKPKSFLGLLLTGAGFAGERGCCAARARLSACECSAAAGMAVGQQPATRARALNSPPPPSCCAPQHCGLGMCTAARSSGGMTATRCRQWRPARWPSQSMQHAAWTAGAWLRCAACELLPSLLCAWAGSWSARGSIKEKKEKKRKGVQPAPLPALVVQVHSAERY